MSIYCVGNIGYELSSVGSSQAEYLGGSGIHFCRGVASTKQEIFLVSQIGDDKKIHELLNQIRLPINTKFIDYHGNNLYFCNQYSAKGKLIGFSIKGSSSIADINKLLYIIKNKQFTKNTYLHIAPLGFSQEHYLISQLKTKKDLLISYQIHFSSLSKMDKKQFMQSLKNISVLFLNKQELDLIAKIYCKNSEAMILYISNLVKKVVCVTNGSHKIKIYSKNKLLSSYLPQKVSVVDPTGAGDVFSGAFLGRLSLGFDLVQCLENASKTAELSIQGWGSNLLEQYQ